MREPFPIRGWVLDVTTASDVTKLWPPYKREPKLDPEIGIVIEQPQIEEHLLTSEVTARAAFKFTTRPFQFLGRGSRLLRRPAPATQWSFVIQTFSPPTTLRSRIPWNIRDTYKTFNPTAYPYYCFRLIDQTSGSHGLFWINYMTVGHVLSATLRAYVDPLTVTLSTPAVASVSCVNGQFGTDDCS